MDSLFDDELPKYTPPPSHVTTKRTGSLKDFFTGHHGAQYTVPVPDGGDPAAFAAHVANSIGRKPAPLSPDNDPVSEKPKLTRTIGQPSRVSLASSADKTSNVVDVEADGSHILGGKGGTSAGITYSASPQVAKDGSQSVVVDKESYGKSKFSLLNPLRAAVGRFVLDPHIKNQIDGAYGSFGKPEGPEAESEEHH